MGIRVKTLVTTTSAVKMKSILALVLCAFLVQTCYAVNDVSMPTKCEDVLPLDTCNQLRGIAQLFGEKVSAVNDAIKDAAAHHITKVKDILDFVRNELVEKAKGFTCEKILTPQKCQDLFKIAALLNVKRIQVQLALKDAIARGISNVQDIYKQAVIEMRDRFSNLQCADVLSPDLCEKLKKFAEFAHLKSGEVVKAIREAVIEHAANAQDLYKKAVDFLTQEITCEKVLKPEVCEQLRESASKLKEKAGEVNEAVRAAINKHLTNAQQILDAAREFLVEKATNFKCEDALSEATCQKIDKIASLLKLKVSDVNLAIKEAIVKGALKAKEIYGMAVAFLRDRVVNAKCEDLVPKDTCDKVRDFVTKVHGNAKDVLTAVKEAITEGAANPADIAKKAVDYIKAKLSCENILSKTTCDRIRAMADKFSISLNKVDEVMREAIARGVTKASDLFQAVVDYIKDKFDIFGDEEEMVLKRAVMEYFDEYEQALFKY